MPGPRRAVLLVVLVIATCVLNYVFTQWGVDLPDPPILTMALEQPHGLSMDQPRRAGLFAAPFVAEIPWIALAAGLILPLALLGVIIYFLIRPDKSARDV